MKRLFKLFSIVVFILAFAVVGSATETRSIQKKPRILKQPTNSVKVKPTIKEQKINPVKTESLTEVKFTATQQEVYNLMAVNIEDPSVISEIKKYVLDEVNMKTYQELKSKGMHMQLVKGMHNEIIWRVGDSKEQSKILPELMEDVRHRMEIDNFPYKEGPDNTFRRLIQLIMYPEVVDFYCEIVDKCKSPDGVVEAIYGLSIAKSKTFLSSPLQEKVLKTLKKALNHSSMRVKVTASSSLINYFGEKKESLPVLINVVSMNNLDSLDKDFPSLSWIIESKKTEGDSKSLGYWQGQLFNYKQGTILQALKSLSQYDDKEAIKVMQQTILTGATKQIRNEAEKLLQNKKIIRENQNEKK